MLEGVMQPEQFLAGALGAHLKPLLRVHTAGSVGASTAITAMTHVASGLYDRVLTVAFEKQSEGNAMWALSPTMPFTPPLVAGAGGFFAPYCRAYIARSGCPPHIGPMTAASARDNAGRNEYAHLREPMTVEDVLNSPVLWDPIRYLETCPSSDGAVALVVASEEAAKKGPRKPAWIKGAASYAEAMWVPGPRPGEPDGGQGVRQARLRPGRHHRSLEADPHRRDLRPVRLVRGHVAREPRLLRRGRRLEAGRPRRGALRRATCRSTRRAACCARTRSAPRACCASARRRSRSWAARASTRCEGAKTALGHAYGGGAQYFAMWVVSSER